MTRLYHTYVYSRKVCNIAGSEEKKEKDHNSLPYFPFLFTSRYFDK